MQLRAEEVSRIIRKQIQDFSKKTEVVETGSVLSVGDGVARVFGLEKAQSGELVEFSNGVILPADGVLVSLCKAPTFRGCLGSATLMLTLL